MKITKTVSVDRIPVFRPDLETATGGFKLDLTGLVLGSVIAVGSAISYDETTRVAKVIASAKVTAAATSSATTYTVAKGHGFAVGKFIGKTVGAQASTITEINTSNAIYDVITVDTTLGAAAEGTALYQASAAGGTGALYAPFTANTGGLLKNSTLVEAGAVVDVVVKGTVYARRIPAIIDSMKAANPLILYSNSK